MWQKRLSQNLSGIEVGDEILRVDGRRVRTGIHVITTVANSNGEELTLEIARNGERREISVIPTIREERHIGIAFGIVGDEVAAVIAGLIPENPAASDAGLQTGDIIVSVNGVEVNNDGREAATLISRSTYRRDRAYYI